MEDWIGINKRSLGIVRVSTSKQDGRVSHETQENEIRSYCARNSLEIVELIRITESAADGKDRRKYEEAMARAESLGCRHVLFYVYDRETRNLTDTEKNERLVREDRLVLHYVRENKVLWKGSPDSDFFMRDIQAASNKQFIRALRTKVVDAMEQKASGGWYPSNSVPLGYIVARPKDEFGREIRRLQTIVLRDPDESRVKWVTREFELRARGLSFQEIRNACVAEGLVPPSKVEKYRAAEIEKRIKNPFYAGRFMWRGREFPGKHELLFPLDLFELAQDIRKRSFKVPSRKSGVFAGGWIRCHECDSTILYDPKTKHSKSGSTITFHYYHCSNGKRVHLSLAGYHVREEEIWRQFDAAVESIVLPPELAADLSSALNAKLSRLNREQAHQGREARLQIEKLQLREDRLYEQLADAIIDRETYGRQLQKVRLERAHIERQLEVARSRGPVFMEQTASSLLELCKSAKALYESRNPIERRQFLEKLCSNPTLERAKLRYELRKPFKVIAIMRETGEWRTHVDDLRNQLTAFLPSFPREQGWPGSDT